ncbi:MAG: cobalamin-binding protein [Burkholderiales bacterium]
MANARIGLLICLLLPGWAAASVSVVDDSGQTITLARPAQRIVSLAPHVTEMLYAVGAGSRLVGAVQYSDYPEAAKKLPRVGGYSQFDLEAIVALHPDLIVGWQSGNAASQVERLKELGIPLYLSEPRHLPDVASTMERLAILAGTKAEGETAARDFRRRLVKLQDTYSRRAPLTAFYEVWNRPLMTVNGEHLIGDVMRLCGAANVFAKLPALTPTIGEEAVLAADPEVIVASGMNGERPQWLDEWKRWPRLRAVRQGNLYFVPPDLLHRPTPRILDGAERLCAEMDEARRKRGR